MPNFKTGWAIPIAQVATQELRAVITQNFLLRENLQTESKKDVRNSAKILKPYAVTYTLSDQDTKLSCSNWKLHLCLLWK